jgi:hypothetical protein
VYLDQVDIDAAQIAATAGPYVTAAIATYGMNTLDKVRDTLVDHASDTTVSIGHRLLNRILGREESRSAIEAAVIDVANGEEDGESALRLQLRKALTSDLDLAKDVAGILPTGSPRFEALGDRSIAIQNNSGIASTGDQASIVR